jgi:hypothetical protein
MILNLEITYKQACTYIHIHWRERERERERELQSQPDSVEMTQFRTNHHEGLRTPQLVHRGPAVNPVK